MFLFDVNNSLGYIKMSNKRWKKKAEHVFLIRTHKICYNTYEHKRYNVDISSIFSF